MTNLVERLRAASFQEWKSYDSGFIKEAKWPVGSEIGKKAADRIDELERQLTELAYAKTDKGPILWEEIAKDAFWQIERLRRGELRKLAYRIYKQRQRLRWWENLFDAHVHEHWRRAHLKYFEIVRRDRDAVAKRVREQALEEAAKEIERIAPTVEVRERQIPVIDDFGEVVGHFVNPAGERKRFITGQRAAAAIRALSVSSPILLQEQSANSGKEGK